MLVYLSVNLIIFFKFTSQWEFRIHCSTISEIWPKWKPGERELHSAGGMEYTETQMNVSKYLLLNSKPFSTEKANAQRSNFLEFY